jgi:hypothetical protein
VTVDTVRGLHITKALVMTAVLQLQAVHREAVVDQGKDPRQGPSESLHLRTHDGWVHNLPPGNVHTRAKNPAYLKLCMSK